MVAFPIRQRVKLPLTPLTAILAAVLVGGGLLLVPTAVLEAVIVDSGIAALLPAAEPPLGLTARLALAITAAAGSGAVAWLGAYLILGGEGIVTLRPRPVPAAAPDDGVPVLRRADAHPDAPARAPLLATRDLGIPFLEVRALVERDLPRDLDAPLSAFDPGAIPDEPAAPMPTVAPLVRLAPPPCEPGERFEVFELPTPTPSPIDVRPIAAPRTDATIHALLDRLERGVSRQIKPAQAPAPALTPAVPSFNGLDETLAELRRLATG